MIALASVVTSVIHSVTSFCARTRVPGISANACAAPLYDSRDAFVGVVGFDLLLDTIQQDLLKLDMGQAGAFLDVI